MSERKFILFHKTADGRIGLRPKDWFDFTTMCTVDLTLCPVMQEIQDTGTGLKITNPSYEYAKDKPKMEQKRIEVKLPEGIDLQQFQKKCLQCKLKYHR